MAGSSEAEALAYEHIASADADCESVLVASKHWLAVAFVVLTSIVGMGDAANQCRTDLKNLQTRTLSIAQANGASLTASFDTKVLQHLELAASAAAFDLLTDTGQRIGYFGVTPDDTIDYDSSPGGRVFSGRNTSTLTMLSLE